MLLVKRANVLLEIEDEDKKYYMDQGYSVIDENGNIVEEALSSDVATLQKEVLALRAQLAKYTKKTSNVTNTETDLAKKAGRPKKNDK